jgi:peptidoglycan/LPS O-acetylase OafA/YrhL
MALEKPRSMVFRSLQAGRGLAALMVVLFHCNDIMAMEHYWGHSWRRFLMFGHSGVQFFFVLSGIVIFYAHRNDIGQPGRFATYAWKRVKRIYPIYWIALIPVCAAYWMVPSFRRGFETEPLEILQSVFLIHLTSVDTILGVAWTLFHEMMFYTLFGLAILNRRLGIAALSLWFAGSVCELIWHFGNPLTAEYLSPEHLLFGFGLGALLLVRRDAIAGLPLALIGAAGYIGCAIREGIAAADCSLDMEYGISAALILCGCMLMEQRGTLHVPKSLKLLGDASYSIYLVHFTVMSAFAKVLYPIWLHFRTPFIVPYTIMFLCAVTSGIAVHLYVEKPLLRRLSRPKAVYALA